MKREGKNCTPEYKAEAVKLALSNGISSTARDLGIGLSTLTKWVAAARPAESAPRTPEETNIFKLQEENRQLREQNQKLLVERGILKKATAFFAGENK